MNPKNHIAWPSLKRIVDETGLSKATACRHFITLEKAGWLVRDGGSSTKNTVYRAVIPKPLQDEINKIELLDDGKGSFTMRLSDSVGSLTMRQGVSHHETKVVSPRDTNRQLNSQSNSQLKEYGQNDHFDRFWEAYPRKVKKREAMKAWQKISNPERTLALITENIDRRIEAGEWLLSEQQYIPHPPSYLNQRRWEDEVVQQHRAAVVKSGSAVQQENNLRVIQNWRPDDAV